MPQEPDTAKDTAQIFLGTKAVLDMLWRLKLDSKIMRKRTTLLSMTFFF
jgi:hypothetical protein